MTNKSLNSNGYNGIQLVIKIWVTQKNLTNIEAKWLDFNNKL